MKRVGLRRSLVVASVLCALAGSTCWAQGEAPAADLEALKRMMQEIIAENHELKARVRKLEEAVNREERTPHEASSQAASAPPEDVAAQDATDLKKLEERVKELETEKVAGEDAVRSIVRQALSHLGSKINESVSLGGTFEVLAGWTKDFSGRSEGVLKLNTAELDADGR